MVSDPLPRGFRTSEARRRAGEIWRTPIETGTGGRRECIHLSYETGMIHFLAFSFFLFSFYLPVSSSRFLWLY